MGNLEMAKECYRRQLAHQPGHQLAAVCLKRLESGNR
jgi:hypothetical protein